MCGISGVISQSPLTDADVAAVRRANAAQLHRGPDGEGEYMSGSSPDPSRSNLFMAMRRLSVIDLEGGWQPLYNEDRSLALIANAEIYNYKELRLSLEATGRHQFRTNSDSETILHLYEEHGAGFVTHLRGMFALALWDSRRRRLIIARDRMGEKPLYLKYERNRLVFTSEMKAMIAHGSRASLSPSAVHQFLHLGFVVEPESMIEGVCNLEPGHMLTVDVDPWRIAKHRYWAMEDALPVSGTPGSLIRSVLEDTMRIIVRSDVPVGVALSSGLDSSLIAAMAQKANPGAIQAFSVGYSGRPRQDERGDARQFAEFLGMPLHEIEISTAEMVKLFPMLNYWRDEPISDIAGCGYYLLSRRAREVGCPVLLHGHGGDELFWGYPWVARAVELTALALRGERMTFLQSLVSQAPKGVSGPELVQWAYLLGGYLQGWKKVRPTEEALGRHATLFNITDTFQMAEAGVDGTYTREFAQRVGTSSPTSFMGIGGAIEQPDILVMKLLCASYLLQNGIAQGDRLSMANSVEVRLPLVDYRLVELVVGLQKSNSSCNLAPKQWLRDAASGIVPAFVLDRPKRGFNPPVKLWIGALRDAYAKDLENGYLVESGVLDPSVARMFARPASRFSVWNDLFIKYLSLEMWCRTLIGNNRHIAPC
jgi:asparagine synthase (glutamine-hydrolysing)